jgi:RNase adaptor protein for sRNA GlmZ degradation
LCTPIRIGLFRSLAKKSPYTVLTVYLDASKETLIKRMKTRAPKAGKYKGTLAELLADLKTYGDPDTGNYDLVLNSEQQSPQQISEAILQKIEDIQQL